MVELKQRIPRFGYLRIVGFGVQAGDIDSVALCCLFNNAIAGKGARR